MIDFNALAEKFGELSQGDMAVALVFGTAGAIDELKAQVDEALRALRDEQP